MARTGTPIVLVAGTVSLSAGGSATPDLGALQNPYRSPMLLDEIRFITGGVTPVISGGTPQDYGGIIRVSLRLGQHRITDGFVPIWNCCASPYYSQQIQGVLTRPGFVVEGQPASGTFTLNWYNVAFRRWKLPKPLWIPEGGVVAAEFFRAVTGNATPDASTVNAIIAYAGRRLDDDAVAPAQMDVPYASAWTSPLSEENSSNTDDLLRNPFNSTLFVQRLTGRILNAAGQPRTGWSTNEVDGSGLSPPRVNMTLQRTTGAYIVPDKSAVGHVLDVARYAWTAPMELAPGEGLQVWLRSETTTAMNNAWFTFGLVGYRKENVS